ncbi:signal transduction histidine kinase [Streptomyces sp. PsTaAH-137]|uniref:sensor histidine kinase n=1 Tax=Streptomyces sp. PsTaAH-137 TaxID=1305830 RepID=UPI000DB9E5A4|nr:ATP-binding protein [Streptomyces sp. SID8367]MYT73640.1 ATP-binding protein [Streptomyces sp. SID8367]RAJ85178.1 signal transduction histidine kinase [Streptomyces sp. PsTaAH-137]
MSVPAPPSSTRSQPKAGAGRPSLVAVLTVLVVAAAAAGGAAALAPAAARTWAVWTALTAWACLAVVLAVHTVTVGRARRDAEAARAELALANGRLTQQSAEAAQLVNVTLPGVVRHLQDGRLPAPTPPYDPQLARILQEFTTSLSEAVQQAARTAAERDAARNELRQAASELELLTAKTFPAAVERLREGASADTVLAEPTWPENPLLRVPAEAFLRELAVSERRGAAAQAASAKALGRVQAKAVSMLADLRTMQERHGEEVFGDLLRLDHATSQLGLMTDRLALLMGGRSSRAWNRPIVMESVLRGAVGRIAAYQRVRLHCATDAAIAGFAAEGVMHLLAELMDNAANFSPPIDEVHVYVEERSAGLVVTIEDSGLKMADAAMRRAEDAVSGQVTDLASLQGTRLGLAVVGRLAAKYGIAVNYRPSSRGGTGVVVLLPPQVLAQQREQAPPVNIPRPAPAERHERADAPAADATPVTPAAPAAAPTDSPDTVHLMNAAGSANTTAPAEPRPAGAVGSTPNGLPVRPPGRTMAAVEQERSRPAPAADRTPSRDAGARFGAFHAARRAKEARTTEPQNAEDTDARGTDRPGATD